MFKFELYPLPVLFQQQLGVMALYGFGGDQSVANLGLARTLWKLQCLLEWWHLLVMMLLRLYFLPELSNWMLALASYDVVKVILSP
jgi:hypothetical protein